MKWQVVGTAVQGRNHIKKNIGCQDKLFLLSQPGFTCISLSDGAGSYKHAEEGAEITTRGICKYLIRNFDFIFKSDITVCKRSIIHAIRTRIGMAAKNKNSTPNEFSSTLLFVSIKKNKFICGHLGDGVIAYVYKDKLQVLSIPESGEFANETYFVTSFNYVEKFKLIKGYVDAIDAFVLMSDGTSNSLYDKRKSTVSPVVSNILNWLDHYTIAEVNDALKTNFETVIRAKTRDDCSIAFVKRKRRL